MKADPQIIPKLIKRIQAATGLDTDGLLCAHLTAAIIAPAGSFVTVSPITNDIRVCSGKEKILMKDIIWEDWPAWKLRWMAGPVDSALAMIDKAVPGLDYMLERSALPATQPPYLCMLFRPGDYLLLASARHNDPACAIVLAILDTISPKNRSAAFERQPAMGSA